MVFSTPVFLTVFLPPVLFSAWALGWLCRRWCARRGRPFGWGPVNALLLAASLLFYFWGEGWGVLWLAASILFNAACAKAVAAAARPPMRRLAFGASIAGNLAFLGWFKYAAFAVRTLDLLPGVCLPVPEVALPLGISFYTFQAMSYVWDVYRREVPPARRLSDFACYLAFFPQLVAGPIVRYADIAAALRSRDVGPSRVASGLKRFLCGLAKKVLVANVVAEAADAVWAVLGGGGAVPLPVAWAGAACYALQIYYDFSGYSDMAIGLGRMLGFDFRENFLHPYAATSVRDFWRRWHVSLSTWFRDYLYIPLGGNRRGRARTLLNGLVVFALCGLWHGASAIFVLWGLWHGLFLTLERILPHPRKIFQPLETFFPIIGKSRKIFSNHWKNKADFPIIGKIFSNRWKTFFQPLENFFRTLPGRIYALSVVLAGWILFRSETLGAAWRMFQSLAGCGAAGRESRVLWLALTPKVLWAMALGGLFSLPAAPFLRRAVRRACGGCGALAELAEWLALTFLGLAALLFIAGGAYNPFIYFRF